MAAAAAFFASRAAFAFALRSNRFASFLAASSSSFFESAFASSGAVTTTLLPTTTFACAIRLAIKSSPFPPELPLITFLSFFGRPRFFTGFGAPSSDSVSDVAVPFRAGLPRCAAFFSNCSSGIVNPNFSASLIAFSRVIFSFSITFP